MHFRGTEEGQPPLGWRAGVPQPEALSLGALGLFHGKKPEALGLPGRGIWSRELCPAVQVPLRSGCISGLQRADSGPSCPGCKPTCGQLGGQLWDLPEPLWQKGANLPSREVVRIDIVHIHFFIRSLNE